MNRPLTKAMRVRDERQSLKQFRLAPDYIDVLVFEKDPAEEEVPTVLFSPKEVEA